MTDHFVLDASVTIRWALQDGSPSDRKYADSVLDAFANSAAWVPALWTTEVVHVLRCAENDAKFGEAAFANFIFQTGKLPVQLDPTNPASIQSAVAAVSREFKLSGYHAQYLELVRRRNVPIATLDKDLRKAAIKASVPIFLLQ